MQESSLNKMCDEISKMSMLELDRILRHTAYEIINRNDAKAVEVLDDLLETACDASNKSS